MIILYDGSTVSTMDATTALVLEARRRGISYGYLVAGTQKGELDDIILDYCGLRHARGRRKSRPAGKTCCECALFVPDLSTRAGGMCPIPKRGQTGSKYTNRKGRACLHFREKEN